MAVFEYLRAGYRVSPLKKHTISVSGLCLDVYSNYHIGIRVFKNSRLVISHNCIITSKMALEMVHPRLQDFKKGNLLQSRYLNLPFPTYTSFATPDLHSPLRNAVF